MTRFLFILSMAGLISCKRESSAGDRQQPDDTPIEASAQSPVAIPQEPVNSGTRLPSNERFRDIRVEKHADGQYSVSGQARVFEATFSYIVEDGHNELASGFNTADAGAPEWGNFSFELHVQKPRENSTMHLVLFESSPKDGARTHELPILLD